MEQSNTVKTDLRFWRISRL